MSLKKFTVITSQQIKEKGTQSLADRPNLTAQYGVSGLSPQQLKLWFDRLATFLAEKINEITSGFSSDSGAEYIRVCLDEYEIDNLSALIESFISGNFASKVLKLYPNVAARDTETLQTIINNIAKALTETKVEDIVFLRKTDDGDNSYNIVYGDGSAYEIVAPRGEKGERGDIGPQGEKGEKGEKGDSGEIAGQNELDKINKDIDNIYTLLGATVTDEYPLSQAYSTRETADGNADIIDGALTRVTKIQGATVATTNLIDITAETQTVSGVTFTRNADNSFTVKGTATGPIYQLIGKARNLPSGNYVLSGMPSTSSRSTYYAYGEYRDENGNLQYVNNDSAVGALTKKNTSTVNIFIYVASGQTVNFTARLMFNSGTTANPYRPYFSGLKNAYFKGIRSTGKNLFNPDRTVKSFGAFENTTRRNFSENALYIGASWSNYVNSGNLSDISIENGTISFKTRFEAYGIGIPFKVTPNTKYRLSYKLISGENIDGAIAYYTADGTYISGRMYEKAFTTPNNCAWMNVIICATQSRDTAQTISYNNVQLEYGDTVTEYEPYKADESFMLDEAVELAKWDYIDTSSKKVVRATRVLTFKGSTNFVQTNADTVNGLYDYKFTYGQTQYLGKGYNAVVKSRPTDFSVAQSGGTTSLSIMVFNNTPYATAEEFNAHLAENPLQVAYQLYNATEEALAIPTDKYKTWVHCSETQVQGDTADTDNSADGANNTVTQDYYTQKGA